MVKITKCAYCGKPIENAGPGRPRRYCNDECYRRALRKQRVSRQLASPSVIDPAEWISVGGAEEALGVSRNILHYFINRGRIKAAKPFGDGQFVVNKASLILFAEQRRSRLAVRGKKGEAEELGRNLAAFKTEYARAREG